MSLKIGIVIILLIILYCLGSGLFYLLYRRDSAHTVKALTWRIVLSFSLFIFLFIAYSLGWISPHGIAPT